MTTRQTLTQTITRLQKRGVDIAMHYMAGRPRCTTKDEGRDISPRLATGKMLLWLEGFECALDESFNAIRQAADQFPNVDKSVVFEPPTLAELKKKDEMPCSACGGDKFVGSTEDGNYQHCPYCSSGDMIGHG